MAAGTDLRHPCLRPSLERPALSRFVTIAALAGFPIALLLAWVFDLTTRGVERTEPLEADAVPTSLVVAILIALAIVFGGAGVWVTRSIFPTPAPLSELDGDSSNGISALGEKPSNASMTGHPHLGHQGVSDDLGR